MKLYLSYITLFLIANQIVGSEKDIPGKYVGHLFGKEYMLNLKNNGKFVSKVITLEPFDAPHRQPEPPPEPKIIDIKTDKQANKKRRKTKGSWIYFESDSLNGIVLKTGNRTDSLFFLENGNLSSAKPPNNRIYNNTIRENDSTTIVIVQYDITEVIGVEYKKIEN